MNEYKVLGGYDFYNHYLQHYSYLSQQWNYKYDYGFKILLEDKEGKVFTLILSEVEEERFKYEQNEGYFLGYGNYCDCDNIPTYGLYRLKGCSKKELGCITYEPIDKSKNTVFILEGADINNHLFSITKYGNEDKYYYTGKYEVFRSNWVLKGN